MILSEQKVSASLREIHPKSIETFKDNYILDFLSLPKNYSEKNLRKRIVQHLKGFILEFGKKFTFVGEEYRLPVGNKDFYLGLFNKLCQINNHATNALFFAKNAEKTAKSSLLSGRAPLSGQVHD